MNLLQALQTLSKSSPQGNGEKDNGEAGGETGAASAQTSRTKPEYMEKEYARPNVMANVLERHEAIANRLRNKR